MHLSEYDYTLPGAYFCTMCVQGRACVLGEVVEGKVVLSECGHIAAKTWLWLAERYPYVTLDEWIVMPNHLHGIIVIEDDRREKHKPLGRLIGAFKTVFTKQLNAQHGTPGSAFWQRDYYERVIRNERELDAIRQYIVDNPLQWELDREHPKNWDQTGGRFTNRPY